MEVLASVEPFKTTACPGWGKFNKIPVEITDRVPAPPSADRLVL